MKVNKNSWHYKLWAARYFNVYSIPSNVSLCSYFWAVAFEAACIPLSYILRVLAKTALFASLPFLAVLALLFGYLPTSFDVFSWSHYKPFRVGPFRFYPSHVLFSFVSVRFFMLLCADIASSKEPVPLAAVIGLFGFWLALTILFWHLVSSIGEISVYVDPYKGTVKPKQPSLLTEYIKAKKAKVCPLVEFVDSEEPNDQD
jgi:hypothetical protein